jgi:hypothetical protein
MKNQPSFVIVVLLAIFLGQSCSFETGTKDKIVKSDGKIKERIFRSGKSGNFT